MTNVASQSEATPDKFTDPRTLEQKLMADKEPWRRHDSPEQPNPLYGLITEAYERDSDYSEGMIPGYHVLDDAGTEWTVIGWHSMLRAELLRAKPNIGDRIGILYKGEGKAKEGQNPPHIYKVGVERNPAGPPPAELAQPLTETEPGDDIPF